MQNAAEDFTNKGTVPSEEEILMGLNKEGVRINEIIVGNFFTDSGIGFFLRWDNSLQCLIIGITKRSTDRTLEAFLKAVSKVIGFDYQLNNFHLLGKGFQTLFFFWCFVDNQREVRQKYLEKKF